MGPARSARRIVARLATMLESPSAERLSAGHASDDGALVRQLVTIHGLAPHLARAVAADDAAGRLAAGFAEWLAGQARLNTERLARMHGELAAILEAAAARGIEVMPLKGALLTTLPPGSAHDRPMGDLDLLIRPADRAALTEVLAGLGYVHEPEANPRPTHDVFVGPGGGRVVSAGEHTDNPRRVELHTEVLRHLWGWLDDDRLTERLWSRAREDRVAGSPALVPSDSDLLAHLAIHASADLLSGRGRLVHWLDLGRLVARGVAIADLPHPRLAYPALRLAARSMPQAFAGESLVALEARVPGRLVRWAVETPLDDRTGLMRRPVNPVAHSLSARISRWAPVPWRLAVAYGDVPLPLALARHAGLIAGRWSQRSRYRAAASER